MDSKHILGLYEAYLDVYSDQLDENTLVDEGYVKLKTKIPRIQAQIRNAGREDAQTEGAPNAPRVAKMMAAIENHKRKKVEKKARENAERGRQNEELDLYDVVLDHLLDEGYCDDVESAEVIMANMSEEWLDCILEKADNTIRLVYGKGGKGVPFGNDGNVLRIPNVGFDKQGDSFSQATRDAARRFAEKSSKKIDSQDGVDARLSATQRKNISRLNAQSNNKQSEGEIQSLTPGGSHYREVPTDYRARRRRASGR